jgi:23S rRNA (guanosine2251-2'-O)-methyltransferase
MPSASVGVVRQQARQSHHGEHNMTDEKLYGVHPVLEALQEERRHIRKVLISAQRRGAEVQRIIALAERRGIPVVTVERPQLHQLLGHNAHQGVVALAEPHIYQPWPEVVTYVTAMSGPHTILVLDSVTDVGNFAALIRSAAAFGVHAMVLPRHEAVPLTPVVAKRSAGAIERMAIVRVANVVRALDELKQHGFWVYGADMQADLTVAHMAWPERVVLVLGAESGGIRRLVRERCDGFIRIPMHAGTNSLNVAMAGAIILAYRWDYCVASCGQRQESERVADRPISH